MKKCPNCSKILVQKDYKGVKTDECPSCGGVWFDRDELRLAKDRTDNDMRWLDFDPFMFVNKEKFSSKKACPVCNEGLHTVKYDKSKVLIDVCDKCKGVWLDKKELDKILKYILDVITSTTAKDYIHLTEEEFKEILTGPEGLISETRDFITVLKFLQLRFCVENPWVITLSDSVNKNWPLK